jgi:hypothetical protein
MFLLHVPSAIGASLVAGFDLNRKEVSAVVGGGDNIHLRYSFWCGRRNKPVTQELAQDVVLTRGTCHPTIPQRAFR